MNVVQQEVFQNDIHTEEPSELNESSIRKKMTW